MSPVADAMLGRLRRDTLYVGAAMSASAFLLWPGHPGRGAGVLGGVLLMALAYAGIRAGVDAAVGSLTAALDVVGGGQISGNRAPAAASRGFVKFFTRHAMLALGAYVMIARFELHPVAMLAGVTAPAVAAAIEFGRIVRSRAPGSPTRSS